MKKIKILVHGKHPEILDTVLQLIKNNEAWQGKSGIDEETVIEYFQRDRYDLVLLGAGISPVSGWTTRLGLNALIL